MTSIHYNELFEPGSSCGSFWKISIISSFLIMDITCLTRSLTPRLTLQVPIIFRYHFLMVALAAASILQRERVEPVISITKKDDIIEIFLNDPQLELAR